MDTINQFLCLPDANNASPPNDLSCVLEDFVNSQKKIMLWHIGTGLGKGYSFVQFAIKNHDKHKIFFLTDRIEVVEEHYRDYLSLGGTNCMHLPNVITGLIDVFFNENNAEALIKISEWNDTIRNCIYNLKKVLVGYKAVLVTNDIKAQEVYENQIYEYNKLLKRSVYNHILFKHPIIKKCKGYKKRKAILEKIEEYSLLVTLFPVIEIRSKDVVFMTINKAYEPIDTIFYGNVSLFHRDYANKAVYCKIKM